MISCTAAYKTQLDSNALSPKVKIVVDGVEYLGDVIKNTPKIKHSSTKFIGTFPAKTVSFTIYDLENSIDFENKEIEVYKGIVVNDSIEYLKQGVFIPRAKNIKTNISERTISFSDVEDRTQLLEDAYTSSLDWSDTHTGLEIVEEICQILDLTLANDNFAFANYDFNQPNFSETITYRGVIAALAEIGGEIAIFNSDGELEIKSQFATNHTVQRKRYEKLSYEKQITINTVVLGKNGVNDDIVYPEEIETDRVEVKIIDNPFVGLYREQMIEEVANNIIGLSYIPFELNGFVDGYMYELNDLITVNDKNGNTFEAVILNIENTSRIKSKISAPKLDEKKTEYNLAGSSKETLNKIRFDVDHNKQQIQGLVTETIPEINEKLVGTVYTQDLESFRLEVNQTIDTTTTELQEQIDELGGTPEELQNTLVTININGIQVSTNLSKISTLITNNAFKIVPTDNPNEPFAFFGYDETEGRSKSEMDNLTVKNYFTAGYHRTEGFTDEETNEPRTGWFYVGGGN